MRSVKKFIVGSCITSIVLFATIFMNETVFAGVGVSPENIEIVVAKDSETTGEYTVVNESAEATHVKVEVEDWFKSRLGIVGIPIEEWFKIEPTEFDMGPKETRKIQYIITPPSGQEGELAAMVFFGTTGVNGAFNITSRFGVSIYVAIENTIELGCEIKSFGVYKDARDPNKDAGTPDKKIVFSVEVENSGNVHIRPTGVIIVTGADGKSYTVNIERGFPVYQGKSLKYGIPWNKTDVAPGKYEARISLDYGSLYKMDKKIEKKISFIVKPDGTVTF